MNEDYPYQQEWENYRFWWKFHWRLLIPLAGIIIFGGLVDVLFPDAFTHKSGWGGFAVLIMLCIFMPAFVFVSLKVSHWACPRCGKSFHSSFFITNILKSKCRHCGLSKYEGSNFYGDWTRNEIW
jgi:ribosomal protein L37E